MLAIKRLLQLTVIVLGIALTACGFRLAGTADFPDELSTIQLQSSNLNDQQQDEVTGRLTQAGATVVDQATEDSVLLLLNLKVLPDRKLVSGGSGGRNVVRVARELRFSLKGSDGTLIAPVKTLRQQRDIELDDDRLLASKQEKANVTRDLEQTLFKQLVNQLQRIKVGS